MPGMMITPNLGITLEENSESYVRKKNRTDIGSVIIGNKPDFEAGTHTGDVK